MAFVRDPNGSFEDNLRLFQDAFGDNFKNSIQASGQRALDTFLGRRRVGAHNTVTRTSHSVTIRSNGRYIGAITSFDMSQTREVNDRFYISPNPSYLPQDIIPANVTSRIIRLNRYELYRRPFEEIFGDFKLENLSNQRNKFSLQEKLVDPTGRTKYYGYIDCFFSKIGYKHEAQGEMVVMYDGEIIFKKRELVI